MGFQGMPSGVGGWDAEREIRRGRSIGFTRDAGVGWGGGESCEGVLLQSWTLAWGLGSEGAEGGVKICTWPLTYFPGWIA